MSCTSHIDNDNNNNDDDHNNELEYETEYVHIGDQISLEVLSLVRTLCGLFFFLLTLLLFEKSCLNFCLLMFSSSSSCGHCFLSPTRGTLC